MFVIPGARDRLRASERERFLAEEWPRVLDVLHRLGLSAEELLNGALRKSGSEITEPRSSGEQR
jgi:GntR family transcriptional regulator